MLKVNQIKTSLKNLLISSHLYRPGLLSRYFNTAYRAKFNNDVSFYSQLLEPGSLCFDIGANIGEKSEVFLLLGMKVIAFEPQPRCVQQLKARCRPYRDNLHIYQTALGKKPDQRDLYVGDNSGVSSFSQDWSQNNYSAIKVPVTTLDSAISEFGKPSYCKIDVEGWEFEVLQGLTQSIPLISIEYHMTKSNIDIVRNCLTYLSQFGELQVNITTAEELKFTLPDWVNLKEFLQLFPDKFQDNFDYRYGDIFIKNLK